MATTSLITESILTDSYQTTVPDAVCKALNLNKCGKIRFTIHPNGKVFLSRADKDERDPTLDSFLTFLAKDIQNNPQNLQPVTHELADQLNTLVWNIVVDLDTPLDDNDE